ncbi:MAG TPA: M14 family metallopeptidase [Candidatus Limnocylindria bacterium]|nr:M14 family metallopeptidase [Candidatus Limnocylindria bacterium]
MLSRTLRRLAALTLLAAPAAAQPAPDTLAVPAYWKTRAERSAYRQTADYDETMRFCRALEAASTWVKVESYGRSGQGRDLPLVILSKDRAFTPEQALALGKPIVLIQNGIHSGEIEGKDASLALMRDMVVTRTREALLDEVVLLVLPIFSVDAHERRSRYNRINQNGPEEMGWRATPIGLNLNRDYVKAEAPEMRAMLSRVYTRWWPHLLVDNHTTNGADYRHDVTYSFNHGPTSPDPVTRWLVDAFEGRVVSRLAAIGHLPAPYLDFVTTNDPRSGIKFEGTSPRFSSGYTSLQCRASVLVETHVLKPYASRVRATYDLLVALLEEINARPAALRSAVSEAESDVVARGRNADQALRTVDLTSRLTSRSEPFPYRGVATRYEFSAVLGTTVPRYGTAPWDTLIPLFRELEPEITVRQPVGYFVPQEWTAATERLAIHSVRTRRFTRAWSDTVEQERIVSWKTRPLFEGHVPDSVIQVELVRRQRTFRPGDLWVPLDQRSALVAVHLFESQAPDGLFHWNAFDTVLQKKEYAEPYVMEPIARQMLRDDPALAREFEARLRSDPALAKSPDLRLAFFYDRSRWADPEYSLIPIARALRRPPEDVLAP